MSATSITEENTPEKIVDNLNSEAKTSEEAIDLNKLASLKAKSQAKQQESKMAAKIVAPKERSLQLGVLGSGQAGCIDGKTNIYLSNYGIISIEDLFYKQLSSSKIENVLVQNNNDICVKLDEEIYTVSIDPETGELKKAKVLAVWKNKKTGKNKIKMDNGASLTCSKTHPSLVFRPSSRRKAFFTSLNANNPLSAGDNLLDTRLTSLDLISEKTFVREIEITSKLAWLIGVFAGDGNSKLNGNIISFYSSDNYLTEKIIEYCNLLPHTSISVNDKKGCQQVEVFGLQFRLFFDSVFNMGNNSTNNGMGNKTYTIDIPSCISAGSSEIRTAFLAGLIDSDGTISKDWCEASVFTTSAKLANKLGCLISSIGGRSSINIHKSKRENEKTGYKVKISGAINFGPNYELLLDNIHSSMKKERLKNHLNNKQKSFTTSSINIKYKDISSWLTKESNLPNCNKFYEKTKINLKNWMRGSRNISVPVFLNMLSNVEKTDQLDYLKVISPRLTNIKEVSSEKDDDYNFFDLSVETYENYVAGEHGFVFTHNSRMTEAFYKLGYQACVVNTALQDLKYIDVPDSNKLLLEYGLGGAAKEIEIGKAAAESHRNQIAQLVNDRLTSAQVHLLCISLGGGSGAGSCETLVDLLADTGKPLVVIAALPMDTEDAQTKSNALETLAKLAKLTQTKRVSNLIVVDNAKIESIYHNVSQVDFYGVANKAIVDPIDAFNTLSSMPSSTKALDPMEFSKLFIDGEGLSVYGEFTVDNYQEDTAIAEAVINNLSGNLLASGFDLKQSKYVGFMVVASKEIWAKIPASSINYASSMINDLCGNPKGVFKGMYVVDSSVDTVKVYSMFSGLGLPNSRVEQLKAETKELQSKVKDKDDSRNLTLNLDTGVNETVSAAQKIKDKIAAKSSSFGKLVTGLVDRRK